MEPDPFSPLLPAILESANRISGAFLFLQFSYVKLVNDVKTNMIPFIFIFRNFNFFAEDFD